MSFTDNLLKQYADKRASKENYLNQFQGRQGTLEDTGFQGTAGTGIQMLNQGMANLLGAFNAGAVRANNNREELMRAEQLGYARDQDAAKMEQNLMDLSLRDQTRKDNAAYQQGMLKLKEAGLNAEIARGVRQDKKEAEKEQLTMILNNANAAVTGEAVQANEAAAKLMGQLEGVNLTTDAAGNFMAPEDASDVIKGKVTQLNQYKNFSVKDRAAEVAGLVGKQFGGKINPLALQTQLINGANDFMALGNKEIDKRVTASNAIIDKDLQNETDKILRTEGILNNSFASDFLGDKDLTASGELNRDYFNEAWKNVPGLQNVDPSVYSSATKQYNKVMNSPEVKAAIKSGDLTEAMINKAAGHLLSKAASTSNWFMDNTLNTDLDDGLSRMLPDLKKFTRAKKAIEGAEIAANQRKATEANKQRILSYKGKD